MQKNKIEWPRRSQNQLPTTKPATDTHPSSTPHDPLVLDFEKKTERHARETTRRQEKKGERATTTYVVVR